MKETDPRSGYKQSVKWFDLPEQPVEPAQGQFDNLRRCLKQSAEPSCPHVMSPLYLPQHQVDFIQRREGVNTQPAANLVQLHQQIEAAARQFGRVYNVPKRPVDVSAPYHSQSPQSGVPQRQQQVPKPVSRPTVSDLVSPAEIRHFLDGLTMQWRLERHPAAEHYVSAPFVRVRDCLVNDLFTVYTDHAFGPLPRERFHFFWYAMPTSVASRHEFVVQKEDGKLARIGFNEMAITECGKLRDVMLYELALGAAWICNNVRCYGDYKALAFRELGLRLPDLKP